MAGAARIRGAAGLGRVPPEHDAGKTAPTGGAHLSVAEEKGKGVGGRVGPGKRFWAGGEENLGREKEKEKGGAGPAGLKSRGGKRRGFAFLKLIQIIQFKLKFREFKFEPNNKQ